MKFGVTLSNRGVLVGLCTTRDLLKLADAVEASPLMDSVWCGDALFVNRRLDALTLSLQVVWYAFASIGYVLVRPVATDGDSAETPAEVASPIFVSESKRAA